MAAPCTGWRLSTAVSLEGCSFIIYKHPSFHPLTLRICLLKMSFYFPGLYILFYALKKKNYVHLLGFPQPLFTTGVFGQGLLSCSPLRSLLLPLAAGLVCLFPVCGLYICHSLQHWINIWGSLARCSRNLLTMTYQGKKKAREVDLYIFHPDKYNYEIAL